MNKRILNQLRLAFAIITICPSVIQANDLVPSLISQQEKVSYIMGYTTSYYHYAKTITGLPEPELAQPIDLEIVKKAIVDVIRGNKWAISKEELLSIKKNIDERNASNARRIPPIDTQQYSYWHGIGTGHYILKYSLASRVPSIDPEILAGGFLEGIQRLGSRISKQETQTIMRKFYQDERAMLTTLIQEKNPEMTHLQAQEHYRNIVDKMLQEK